MSSGRIQSGCSRFWTTTKSFVTDCIPRRVRDDTAPILHDEKEPESSSESTAGFSSRLRLARLSGAVCGIEFCYAAETAFVSPVLLRIGIPPSFMTMIWCLSPLMGLFLMPLLGSASDRCTSKYGRRRPFILLLSASAVLGLLLVPYGWPLGTICDVTDYLPQQDTEPATSTLTTPQPSVRDQMINILEDILSYNQSKPSNDVDATTMIHEPFNVNTDEPLWTTDFTNRTFAPLTPVSAPVRACGIAITIVGLMLLDFSCDACQSPARAYLIDVTHPTDHSKGLATFSFMAGLGGAIGYIIGAIPWGPATDDDPVTVQVRVVFGIVLAIFVVAVGLTVTAEKEKTLYELYPQERRRQLERKWRQQHSEMQDDSGNDREKIQIGMVEKCRQKGYGTSQAMNPSETTTTFVEDANANVKPQSNGSVRRDYEILHTPDQEAEDTVKEDEEATDVECCEPLYDNDDDPPSITMGTYLLSIVFMPWSLRILCITHLLGWMSLLCYSLYFTDFVGQAVYGGDPTAPPGSPERILYADGVRMGSFAMAVYSMTCSVCSYNVHSIIKRIGAKPVYIANHLVYCVGMLILANVRTLWASFVFSACAGIQYSTLFTVPFVLLANYHTTNMFDDNGSESSSSSSNSGLSADKGGKRHVRGLGTDISLVQGMVFVAQLALSSCMGSLVQAFDSTVVVIVVAAILSFFGALSATQVNFADL